MRNLNPSGLAASALVHVVWTSELIAWSQLSNRAAQDTQSLAGVWCGRRALVPALPDKAVPSCWIPQGVRPESYLVDISRDCFGNRQLFSPGVSCTHSRRRDTPPLVSGIAGCCLGSRLTWLEVSSGTEQQEKNEAERCRIFFHSILCSLFWALKRGKPMWMVDGRIFGNF